MPAPAVEKPAWRRNAAGQPADHPGQPHRRRHGARSAGPDHPSNPGATRILRAGRWRSGPQPGRGGGVCQAFGAGAQKRLRRSSARSGQDGLDHWQQSFELRTTPGGQPRRRQRDHLVARAPMLPGTRDCWCSTTSPRSSRRSAPRPGASGCAAWRTRSRTRSPDPAVGRAGG